MSEELEPVEGFVVALPGRHLEEPVTERLLRRALPIHGANLQHALWVALADGSVLAELTRLARYTTSM